MSSSLTMDSLAFDEVDASQARTILWKVVDDAREREKAYVSLSRWTWRILVERRLDVDLRDWHRLILDYASTLARHDSQPDAKIRGERVPLAAQALAERLKGFADLVGEQIRAAEISAPEELAKRAHVTEVLVALSEAAGEHLEREAIKERSGLKDANLSRVLTLLAANGVVERQPRGRHASFRITQRGLAIVRQSRGSKSVTPRPPVEIRIAPPAAEPQAEPQMEDVAWNGAFIQVRTLPRQRVKEAQPSIPKPKPKRKATDNNGHAIKEADLEILQYA